MRKLSEGSRLSPPQKASRFSIRASDMEKRIIGEAARIKETTMSDFVLQQSLAAAHKVLADQATFTVSRKQWDEICAALDAPPRSIPVLRKLLANSDLLI